MKSAMLAVLTVCAVACGSGGDGGGSDAGASAAAASCKHPTPPKQACQVRWCDNEWGVGMPCTKGGGECLDLKTRNNDDGIGAVMCTAAYSDNEAFCTKPCGDDSDCGKGARCVGDPDNPSAGRGCMLVACAGPADADAGEGDTDGGAVDGSGAGGDATAAASDATVSGD